MLINIQLNVGMEQATTSYGPDAASNSMTRGVKYALLQFVIVAGGCGAQPLLLDQRRIFGS